MAVIMDGKNTDISGFIGSEEYKKLPTRTRGMRNVGGLKSGSHHQMPKIVETETTAEKWARISRPENLD